MATLTATLPERLAYRPIEPIMLERRWDFPTARVLAAGMAVVLLIVLTALCTPASKHAPNFFPALHEARPLAGRLPASPARAHVVRACALGAPTVCHCRADGAGARAAVWGNACVCFLPPVLTPVRWQMVLACAPV